MELATIWKIYSEVGDAAGIASATHEKQLLLAADAGTYESNHTPQCCKQMLKIYWLPPPLHQNRPLINQWLGGHMVCFQDGMSTPFVAGGCVRGKPAMMVSSSASRLPGPGKCNEKAYYQCAIVAQHCFAGKNLICDTRTCHIFVMLLAHILHAAHTMVT